MELKKLVADYATRNDGSVVINLEGLAHNKEFRNEVIREVLKKVKKTPHLCVFIPSFKATCNGSPMGKLVNELVLTLQLETLVTGNIEKLSNLHIPTTDIIIIKQSFRSGKELSKQVERIKNMGCNVSILCLVAHSRARLEAFAAENKVQIEALVCTDEIQYL